MTTENNFDFDAWLAQGKTNSQPAAQTGFDLDGWIKNSTRDVTGLGTKQAEDFNAQLASRHFMPAQTFDEFEKYSQSLANHYGNKGYSPEQVAKIQAEFAQNADPRRENSYFDWAKHLMVGTGDFATNVVGAFAPDSEAHRYLKGATEDWRKSYSPADQIATHIAEKQFQQDIANGTNEAVATAKMFWNNPMQAVNLAVENAPQLVLGGAGKFALGAANALAVAGSYRDAISEAWKGLSPEQAMQRPEIQSRMAKGMSFEEAVADASTDLSDNYEGTLRAAVIGGIDAASPLGKLGQGLNKGVIKTFGKEVLTEAGQETLEQLNENYGVGQIDGKTKLMDGVQRAAVMGAVVGTPFATATAADAYLNRNAPTAEQKSEQFADEIANPPQPQGATSSEKSAKSGNAVDEHVLENVLAEYKTQVDEEQYQKTFDELKGDIEDGLLAERANSSTAYGKLAQAYLQRVNSEQDSAKNEPITPEEVVPEIRQPTTAQKGASTQIQLGSQGEQQVDYELVEEDELSVNLKPNIYQNRDRTSADSQMQINEYARNLNPAYLGASVDVTQGAPTVDENYGVFAGNGRLSAIQQAYAKHPEKAAQYKGFLSMHAAEFGFSPEQVNQMHRPVLVRKVNGKIDVPKAVEEGNFNTGLDKGVLGDATANAKYLTPDLLREVQINEDGTLNLSDSNTPFIQGLVGKIPVEQRPKFFAEQRLGNQSAYTLTAQGKEMVENALLVKAFSDPNNPTYSQNLLTDLIVSTDESSKRVKNALISVAGKVIQTKNNPDFDISGEIAQAYALMRQGKQDGRNVGELLAQQDFVNSPSKRVQALTRLFYSPKSVGEVQEPLNAYFDSVINSNLDQTQQDSMFGDEFAIDRDELMNQAGISYSKSPMKSVEANIARGRKAMTKAILKKNSVHRAMYNPELDGWVDFEWGDTGQLLASGKTKGAMGIAHIIESRMRKDNMNYAQVIRMLTERVVNTIAKGQVSRIYESGKVKSVFIEHNGNRATLIKREGSNSWLMNAFELKPTDEQVGSNDPNLPTQTLPTRQRQDLGAVGANNVQQSAPQSNIDPEIEQAKTLLRGILGDALVEQIQFTQSQQITDPNPKRQADKRSSEGFVERGKLTLVVDNITEGKVLNRSQRLAWVAWHELAHAGIEVKYGNAFQTALNFARSNPVVRVIGDRIAKSYANDGITLTENQATEEAIVELYAAAQTDNWAEIEQRYGVKIHHSWKRGEKSVLNHLARIAYRLRNFIRTITGAEVKTASDQDVLNVLRKVKRSVRELAKNAQSEKANEDVRYSLNENADSEFAKAVDDFIEGNAVKTSISMGTTPDVLKMIGLPDVEVKIQRKTLGKIMRGKHAIEPEILKQLPKQLNDPVGVFKSAPHSSNPDGYVVLTELTEFNSENNRDEPVIAALHLDKTGEVQLIEVASAYGKNHQGLQNILNKDKAYYWNKEKGSQLANVHWLQLPLKLRSEANLYENDIKTETDLSQYQAENLSDSDDVRFSRSSQVDYRFKGSDVVLSEQYLLGSNYLSLREDTTVGQLLNATQLFEYYPQLADIQVKKVDQDLFSPETPYGIEFNSEMNTVLVGNTVTKAGNLESFLTELLKNKVKQLRAAEKRANKIVNAPADKVLDKAYLELAKRYKQGDMSVESQLREMVEHHAQSKGFNNDTGFRMQHTAPNASDDFSVSGDKLNEMVGDDIYSARGLNLFRTGDDVSDRESFSQILRMENNPNALITIYRAIPKSFTGTAIGDGDWVTLSRAYAKQHGESALKGDYKIVSEKVKAKDIYWNGDSINEFGYDSGKNHYRSSTANRNKSSDLITYSDSGKIIPLSKRFNSDKSDIRYSRPQSALDLSQSGKAKAEPSVFDTAKRGELRKVVDKVFGKLDEWIADGLRPVNDWISQDLVKGGVTAHEAARLRDDMYRTKGVRDALNADLEQKYLKPLLQKVASLSKSLQKKDKRYDELSVKRLVGFWVSARYSIERNQNYLTRERQAMLDAEAELKKAQASGNLDDLDKAETAYRATERQYRYRKQDVESTDFSKDRQYKVGTAGGWSIPLARQIMANIEQHIDRADLDTVANILYDLNKARLDIDLASGRYTQQQYDEYQKDRHYVPLTGDPRADEGFDFIAGTGSNAVNIGKDKGDKGRTHSEAEDAIDAVWQAVGKTTTFAGWADFKNAIDHIYESEIARLQGGGLSAKSAKEQVEKTLGITKQKMQGLTRSSDDVLIRKEGGSYYEYRIPAKAMEALKNDNVENANAFLKLLSKPTGWYARGVTQWTLTFVPMNMMRDTWEKSEFIRVQTLYDANGNQINDKTMDKIGRGVLKQAVSKETWQAVKRFGLGQELRDNVPSEKALKTLLKNGGVSTYSTYLARTETDLIKDLKAQNRPIGKLLEKAGSALESYNKVFDTVSALAAYKSLIENGIDEKQAAATTLELTNFRKTGSKMRGIKALYMFSQPTAMGGRNLIKFLSTPKGQKRFVGYMAVMIPLYLTLRAMDDDDEGGNIMDQLGDITRYIPIPLGDGKYFKIPVGFGMPQMAWNFSVNMVKAGVGDISMSEAGVNMFTHSLKTFAPISPSEISAAKFPLEKLTLTATPTILQPLMQNVLNRSAFGNKITTNFVRDDKLKAEQSKSTTAQFWKDVAMEMNDVLGIDMHPEQIKNLFDGYGSILGSLKELQTIFIENPNREQLGRRTRTPFLNQFIGTTNEFAIQSRYYEASEEAQDFAKRYQSQKERGNAPVLSQQEKAVLAFHQMNATRMGKLRSEKANLTKALRAGKMSPNVYEAKLKAYNQEVDKVQRFFLKRWREIQGLNTH